ncbi:hypothetical protein [Streptomyces zaomyceticus]|uniref:hypothetical protein n=1 Tax=Streptomyces zaomyceticus TaxID=68286 RepID=UPI0037A17C69
MTDAKLEKARAAAAKAAEELAKLEAQEAEKAAQEAAERDAKQRELDNAFLAQWESLDAELEKIDRTDIAAVIYAGGDPLKALADRKAARKNRNAIRDHARKAYGRVHGTYPPATVAPGLTLIEPPIEKALEMALGTAVNMLSDEYADKLYAKWTVPNAD